MQSTACFMDQGEDLEETTQNKRESKLRIPDKRRLALYLMALTSCICLILTIVVTVNPVPVFSSSRGLMSVTAPYPPVPGYAAEIQARSKRMLYTAELQHHQRHDIPDAQTWNDACDCFVGTDVVPVATPRPRTSATSRFATTTYTTTTAIRLNTHLPRPTLRPSPTATSTAPSNGINTDNDEPQGEEFGPGAFAALFLGVSGGCLQRRSGVLVCTGNSLSPNFVQIYEVAGLAANVTAQLPSGTSGASIGILVAIILYATTTLMFVMALLPSVWIHGPVTHGIHGKKAPSLKHQWTVMVATGLASASTFAVVISAVRLRNAFGASAAAVEAWDVTHILSAKLLSAFSYLYASAVLSGATVVLSLSTIVYDFHRPWWLQAAKENTLSFVEPAQQRSGGSRRRRSTGTTGISYMGHGADAPMYGPANPAFDTRTMLSGAPTAIHLPMGSVGGRNGASVAHPSRYRI